MYVPPAFALDDLPAVQDCLEACGLAHFVTWTGQEMIATPLPFLLVRSEGPLGTLYGHLAKANEQWRHATIAEALAIFSVRDAYVTPSWYATKAETGKVVPTWNYELVHAYGTPEFVHDQHQLLDIVTRLTDRHEGERAAPWHVDDAPAGYVAGQLRGIVGIRMPIARLTGKSKLGQNKSPADRAGVAAGLSADAAWTRSGRA